MFEMSSVDAGGSIVFIKTYANAYIPGPNGFMRKTIESMGLVWICSDGSAHGCMRLSCVVEPTYLWNTQTSIHKILN